MDEIRSFDVTVNGYTYEAKYSAETVDRVFVPLLHTLKELHDRLGRRTVVFLAAPPGTGKSTIALVLEMLAKEELGRDVFQAVGLDGFHYYNDYLKTHAILVDGKPVPLKAFKGTPETFDLIEFKKHLDNLTVMVNMPWPVYDRTIHNPRPKGTRIYADIVLIEGNYLLLDEEYWQDFAKQCDYSIFIGADEADLRERLIARKARGGVSYEEALAHYERTDGPNVRRVLAHVCPHDEGYIFSEADGVTTLTPEHAEEGEELGA